MAGGVFAVDGNINSYSSRITAAVVMSCTVAASGGLLFGYAVGISGGVTTMDPFLKRFFPPIWRKMKDAKKNGYCIYDNQVLISFTSSLYLAGLFASLVASRTTRTLGRKATIMIGGCTFLLGAAISGAALNVVMLIFGRILLGFGVGFTNQATPLYLSEVAPPKWRGACNTGFEIFIGIGVLAANCINYFVAGFSWGWRLSLGLAAAPATILTVGAILISDTPSSLVERGKVEDARKSLRQVRGIDCDIEIELADLVKTSEASKTTSREPFVSIFKRQHRPHLVMAMAIPLFQQLTGINIVAFYAPVLFHSVGFGRNSALIAALVLGLVNLGSVLVSSFLVDRHGRRFLFMAGGIQMMICQIAVAAILGATFGVSGDKLMLKGYGILVLVLMCVFAAGFGWSWGPLNWLIPSEILPIKIRPTGQSISIAVHSASTFVLSQAFSAMLCHFKYGMFLFYAGWITLMTVFVVLFLPETKGVPLESMQAIWERHWFWQSFVQGTSIEGNFSN